MDTPRDVVVIGQFGTQLDAAEARDRFTAWRPTYSLFHHDELLVRRLELLVPPAALKQAESLSTDIEAISPETEIQIHPFPLSDPWDFEGVFSAFHTFARQYPFDPDREEYLLHITTGTHVSQICMFLLAESGHFPAKLLQSSPRKRGHEWRGDYNIIDLDLSQYDAIANRFQQEQQDRVSFLKLGIETRNHNFNRMIEEIEHVAIRSDAPILLQGPTGAGKTQLARRIYELKHRESRMDGPFVEVNCATVRGDQAMSLLFGHTAGAFTGAVADRSGLLRSADGGLLFLDEIGELGLDEQAMLLRAIEEKRFLPVGSDEETTSNFELIAGTNRDLGQQVRDGSFREDLLARIQLWTFTLPGLAERREDIEPNLMYELREFAGRSGQRVTINREAQRAFLSFALDSTSRWAGNFRDLGAAVTRMATLASGNRITMENAEREIERLQHQWRETDQDLAAHTSLLREFLSAEQLEEVDTFDLPQLALVIETCQQSNSLSEAGRALFQASRKKRQSKNDADRLRKYLHRFGLDWDSLKRQARR